MDRRDFVCWSAGLALAGPAWAKSAAPSFRIGVVADVQYADMDDDPPHFYRAAPARLGGAVVAFNRTGVDFAVNLGDAIQGDWRSFDTILAVVARLKAPWHAVLGNHDFAVADDKKALVPSRLGMPARYDSFDHKGWRFVVLDGTDLSTFAWPAGSEELERGRAALAQYPAGKPWNGAIGPEQLGWLDETLSAADAQHRKVALLCHFPLLGKDETVLWNAPEVLAHIEPHRSVKLWLNGHDHAGGYAVRSGIHHLTMKGMLDTPETAYAVLSFAPDRVDVAGAGREVSRTLTLRSS